MRNLDMVSLPPVLHKVTQHGRRELEPELKFPGSRSGIVYKAHSLPIDMNNLMSISWDNPTGNSHGRQLRVAKSYMGVDGFSVFPKSCHVKLQNHSLCKSSF
jgi:hypothetical protein